MPFATPHTPQAALGRFLLLTAGHCLGRGVPRPLLPGARHRLVFPQGNF